MGSRTLTGKEAKSCRNAARMESPMIRKGQVVRFTLCTPESEPCPQFAAYTNLGSWVVANCEDCKPPPALTPSPDRVREFAMFLDEIARSPLILEKLRDLGLIPKLPPKPKRKRRAPRSA